MARERDSRIVVKSDARAIGAVTALSVGRHSERWRGSGTKSGPCVSIFPGQDPIPFVRTRSDSPATRLRAVRKNHAESYADRLRKFGATGDVD